MALSTRLTDTGLGVRAELDDHDTQLAQIVQHTTTPIVTYTHSSNLEVVVSALDIDTNVFTSVAHGLVDGDIVAPTLNLTATTAFPVLVYPVGFPTSRLCYVVNKTDNTFSLSATSGGAVLDFTSNANMDLTKWHFEKRALSLTISNLPSIQKMRVVIKGKSLHRVASLSASYALVVPTGAESTAVYHGLSTGLQAPSYGGTGDVGEYIEILINGIGQYSYMARGSAIASNTDVANIVTPIAIAAISSTKRDLTFTSLALQLSNLANGSIVEVYRL